MWDKQREIFYCLKRELDIGVKTSSNHRLGNAGLNALEELLFRCWQ